MLSVGHISASFILSQSVNLIGYNLNRTELILIIIAGNIIDIDFIFGLLFGKKGQDHHNFITHTPFGIVILWILYLLLFGGKFSLVVNILILAALIFHLILDDIGHWFHNFKLQEIGGDREINWFYPITKFSSQRYKTKDNFQLLNDYLTKARANFVSEIILLIFAIFLLF